MNPSTEVSGMNLSLLWRTHPSSPGVPYGVGGRPANSEGPGSSPLLPEKIGQPLGQMALSLSQTRNTVQWAAPQGGGLAWVLFPHSPMPYTPHRVSSVPLQVRQHKTWVTHTEPELDPHIAQTGPRTERLLGNQRHRSIRGKSETDTQSSETGPPGASGGGSKSLILSPGTEKGINQTESKREKAPSSLPGQVHKFRPGCRGSYKEGKWD